MKKQFLFWALMMSMLLLVSACSQSGEAKETTSESATPQETAAKETSAEAEGDVNTFVLENTKIVEIFNISKRVDSERPEQGPFFVVRGIDATGKKSEVWIRDMKIHEIKAVES